MNRLTSVRIEDNPRHQAALRTCERSGSPLSVSEPDVSAEGWTWAVIALLCVTGLAVVGLAQ